MRDLTGRGQCDLVKKNIAGGPALLLFCKNNGT